MDSKFKFEPLGATKSAQRNSNSFTVIWRTHNVNLGVVRKSSAGGWTGLYAWQRPSPPLETKNAVAEWMLVQYMTWQEQDVAV